MAYTAKPAKVPTWATNTGTNILTGLTATAAEWQSNVTSGSVTYGIIRYTFSGSPDLSTVTAGHALNVTTGFVNAENKISGLEILTINNASDWVEVKSFERLSAALDETGVSATSTTITSTASRIMEPSTAKKGVGFLSPEKPSDGVFNWLLYYIGAWITMLDANYPTGFMLQGRLTQGAGISITDNGDNTYLIANDGGVSTGTVTQAAHGFVEKDQIRWTAGAWAKAQGNSIAGCTDVWTVISRTTDTFVAVKSGRVTITGHGLTTNTLYYLSASSAGALTSTKPVGSTSAPLGYYLPCVYVESANVLHILGQAEPTFNPVYAEYIASTTVGLSSLSFTGISLNNISDSLRIKMTARSIASSLARPRIKFSGISTYHYNTQWTDSGASYAWAADTASSTSYIQIGRGASTSDARNAHLFEGTIAKGWDDDSDGSADYNRWAYSGTHTMARSGVPIITQNGGSAYDGTNITNVDFSSSSGIELRAGNYIRLIIDQMPES